MPDPFYLYIEYKGFCWVGFYAISTIVGYSMPDPFYIYVLNIYRILLGWVLCHVNHCRLFNARSFLYICTEYIGFYWVGFYAISIIVSHLMSNPLCTYILNRYNLVWLGFMVYLSLLIIKCQILFKDIYQVFI